MISIRFMPPDWGFGNRLLYYNNLRQLAEARGDYWSCVPWEGHQHFTGDMMGEHFTENIILEPCLGERFFECHKISTRKIFQLKKEETTTAKTAAIHFRGTDFFEWNPNAVLNKNYYLDAIELIKDKVDRFILFTDDVNLPSYHEVEDKFENEEIKYSIGENSSDRLNYIGDFKKMCECDYIISSPSTYCICAGFIGKYKKIIHSKEWLENRTNVGDKFWVDLYNGGNNDYRIWKLV